MTATVTPIPNPNYIGGNPEALYSKCKFHSRVFRISEVEGLDESGEYEKLMSSMHPFDLESNSMLNPTGNSITKNWTKDGDLLIHVEWIEMLIDESVDSKEF